MRALIAIKVASLINCNFQLAEDGVRLGCYGHEQDGKQYSTHYVADNRGYRLVRPDKTITVFPKDGSEPRNASFAKFFNSETITKGNVKYVFPEGCEAPFVQVDVPKVEEKAITARPTTTKTTTTTPALTTIAQPEPETTIMPDVEDICADKCCDEDRAEIILPTSNTSGCCRNISKIVVPIDTDMLSRCTIEEIVEITNEADKVKMLKKLLKFTMKYKF